jgi:hypothetical protein
MREFLVASRLCPCQDNEMAAQKFLFSFFVAKKFEKDYDNSFAICAEHFSCVSAGSSL